jgi:ribosomal protein S12 methylthiotransferase accessory factor
MESRPRWIPASLAYLASGLDEQDHWLGISTGCAAHPDPVQAIVTALLEVCERDSIALLWERRLALPRVPPDALDPEVQRVIAWKRRHFIDVRLYDATSDLGVPTVYDFEWAPHSAHAAQLVSAAAAADIPTAARKAVRESIGAQLALERAGSVVGRDGPDFERFETAAAFMGRRELRSSFDFLDADPAGREGDGARSGWTDTSPRGQLRALLARLQQIGAHAFAVDLTTPYSRTRGRYAVRAVVPELQPFSAHPFVRYRAHPRLYQAFPSHPPVDETELNPDPQPFP